jgi:uncharacterized protein with FMN-binding domain
MKNSKLIKIIKNVTRLNLIYAVILIFAIIPAVAGCGKNPGVSGRISALKEPVIQNTGKVYNNGTFIGYSDASDHGYGMAVVTVENDRITDVVLKEFTELSVEKDFSTYEYEPSVKAHAILPQKIKDAGSPYVEGVAGATASSARYRQAVERALARARKEKPSRIYFNGIFQGRSRADNHGYGIALIRIENDRIVSVEIKEVDEKGEFKDFSTYPYEPSRKAYVELPARFIEKNSPDIDNFTGATHSTEKYKEAVGNALAKAEIRSSLPDLIDGTYTAVSDADHQGYAEARVTVENGVMVDVRLREFNELSVEKDFSTYEYEPSVNANRELPWAFIAAQSAGVDAVTGATHSSRHYSQAVERALIKASWAREGEEYFDGVFQARSSADEHGYCVAVVTVEDGKIQDVVLKDIDEKGRLKDFESYPYEPSRRACEELPEKFVKANSWEVDIVAGATRSSLKYREAVKRAMESARR